MTIHKRRTKKSSLSSMTGLFEFRTPEVVMSKNDQAAYYAEQKAKTEAAMRGAVVKSKGKLSDEQVREIRRLLKTNSTLSVATMTGYSFAVIRGIHEGLNYKNVKD